MITLVPFWTKRTSSTHIGLANHTCINLILNDLRQFVIFLSNPFSNLLTPFRSPLPSFLNLLPIFMVPSLQHHRDSSSNLRKLAIVLKLIAQDSIVSTPSPPIKSSITSSPLPTPIQANKTLAHPCSRSLNLNFFFLLLSFRKQ